MSTTMALLPVHIVAGATAIIAGFVALFARKGAAPQQRDGFRFRDADDGREWRGDGGTPA